jgi:hypothetical protein
MSLYLFVVSLILTLGTVGAALLYLRGITRRVLVAQCGSDTGAEFWLRAADVLALASIFVTLVLVASGVWRKVPAREAARASETAL